jgi:phytoene/squalene synthetase
MNMQTSPSSDHALAESITWAASKQTYLTIRFLADRQRAPAAYKAYAYFRWVDDCIDQPESEQSARIAFVERQKALMESLLRGEQPGGLSGEEALLADLVHSDPSLNSGLRSYITNLMSVMAFDAYRRGRLISQLELTEYTRWLATAVTEAMHYFIGHDCASPRTQERYLAVSAAHIVHMLRDAFQDTPEGYINIPTEILETYGIRPQDFDSPAYRLWVRSRVELARVYFKAGTHYLAQVANPRCRLSGYAYTARFTRVLDCIEKDGYLLKGSYPECKRPGAALRMSWRVLSLTLSSLHPERATRSRSEA